MRVSGWVYQFMRSRRAPLSRHSKRFERPYTFALAMILSFGGSAERWSALRLLRSC